MHRAYPGSTTADFAHMQEQLSQTAAGKQTSSAADCDEGQAQYAAQQSVGSSEHAPSKQAPMASRIECDPGKQARAAMWPSSGRAVPPNGKGKLFASDATQRIRQLLEGIESPARTIGPQAAAHNGKASRGQATLRPAQPITTGAKGQSAKQCEPGEQSWADTARSRASILPQIGQRKGSSSTSPVQKQGQSQRGIGFRDAG
jgi:hypothetical protein